jgi:hypothetical protein
MPVRSLGTAIIEAETAYLEAMINHEAERSESTYAVMARAAERLEVLEAFEVWWEESGTEEAANHHPLMGLQEWQGAPR